MIPRGKNIPIEGLRFLFMLQICLWHFNKCYGIMNAGFLGVEFFFILSGFFMYLNIIKNKPIGVINFTILKVKKFYLDYAVAVIFAYILFSPRIWSLFQSKPVSSIFGLIGELLMVQNIGIVEPGLNKPLWFFSVLIYGSAIVYNLISSYRLFSVRILFPIGSLLYLTYIFDMGSGFGLEQWNVLGCLSMPFIRGTIEISIGVLIATIWEKYKDVIIQNKKVLNIACILSFLGYILVLVEGGKIVVYSFLFIAIFIVSALVQMSMVSKIFKSTIWLKLGSLTFDMFLTHFLLASVVMSIGNRLGVSQSYLFITYVILIIPVALAFKLLIKALKYRFFRNNYSNN